MQNFVSKKLCWFMILILIFMWSGIVEYKAFAEQKKDWSSEELKQTVDKLERLFNALEEAMEELPRDTFDPNAIIETVGKDSIKLFEWVRDNTYLVPYRGSLRGPIGVLMDRLGNSLDRSLLVYELLRLGGHKVRLAQGTLSEEQVKESMKKIRSIPKRETKDPRQLSIRDMTNLIEKYIYKYKLNREQISGAVKKMIQEQEQMEKEITTQVKAQISEIYQAVKDFRKDQDYNDKNLKLTALQNHWWVQMKKDDNWLDLDPTLPDAEPGKGLTRVEDIYEPDDLGDDLFHVIKIRVIVEQWKNGSLKENKAFEYTLKPSELFGNRVVLGHVPMNWPEDLNLFEEKNPFQRLKTVVLDQKEWLPVLILGSSYITASSFTDSGEINDKPGKKPESGAGGLTRGIFGALAGKEETKHKSHLTAEWIEYEICSPGHPVKRIRRKVFDLIGPAVRQEYKVIEPSFTNSQRMERGFSLLSEREIIIQVCQLTPDFFIHLMAKNMLANRDILSKILRQDELTMHKDLAQQTKELTPFPGPEYTIALARGEWSRIRDDVYIDRPNIFYYFREIRQNQQGNLIGYHGFDIVANEVAIHSNSEADPFRICLEQGVLDTNTEALIMGSFGGSVENTAKLFAETHAQGIKWLTIDDVKDPEWQRIELPNHIRVRIEQDLAQGYAVLIPEKSITLEGRPLIGWWQFNPRTGNILGVMSTGKGQALTEYSILKKEVVLPAVLFCGVFAFAFMDKQKEESLIWCAAGATLWVLFAYTESIFILNVIAIILIMKILLKVP